MDSSRDQKFILSIVFFLLLLMTKVFGEPRFIPPHLPQWASFFGVSNSEVCSLVGEESGTFTVSALFLLEFKKNDFQTCRNKKFKRMLQNRLKNLKFLPIIFLCRD